MLKPLSQFEQLNLLFSTTGVTCSEDGSEVSTKDSLLERGMSVALTGAVCLRTGLISSVLLRFDLDRTASAGLTVETAWELDPAAP